MILTLLEGVGAIIIPAIMWSILDGIFKPARRVNMLDFVFGCFVTASIITGWRILLP